MLSTTKCVNASIFTVLYEFPSEDVYIGHLVSNGNLSLKYKHCPIKSCFSAFCFYCGKRLFN